MQLLDEKLHQQFEQLARERIQAVLLEGVQGHEATCEAVELAEAFVALAGGSIRTLSKPDDKTVIGIEQVQSLYRTTRAKQAQGVNVWIIEQSQLLSENAQNAFLKLLEEPPESVVFILSVNRAESLLSTIRSRCRIVRCTPLSADAASAWLAASDITDASTARQLLFLAENSPTELKRLVEDSSYCSAQLQAAGDAKTLIGGQAFEQIKVVAVLAASRDKALHVTKLALRMLMMLAPQRAGESGYVASLRSFSNAYERILHNGNIRIQLLRAIMDGR